MWVRRISAVLVMVGQVSREVTQSGVYQSDAILPGHRGCQFTSAQLARFARGHNLARSVGRTGVCWDNAQQESFWATMRVEFYDR